MDRCENLWSNRDWDPVYLSSIFDSEFEDFLDLWSNDMEDSDLLKVVNEIEK